jgi:hypothetical protein
MTWRRRFDGKKDKRVRDLNKRMHGVKQAFGRTLGQKPETERDDEDKDFTEPLADQVEKGRW